MADLAREATNGKLEYRVIDYLTPYTVYYFDPHLPQGHLLAHLSTFRVANVFKRPTFKLTRRDDTGWFDHFVAQFDIMWREAETYEPA